jgi:hypothetical protein
MSACVLVLAGLVPGDGPGPVSGEVTEGLELSGHWHGRWVLPDGTIREAFVRPDWVGLGDAGLALGGGTRAVCR